MPDASVAGLFRQSAQGVHHRLAEWLRICCTYLGIAVIVTISMSLALPGLRDQALQVHKALLTALAPTSVPSSSLADANDDPLYDTPSVVAMAIPAAPLSNATGFLGPLRSELPPAPPKKVLRTAVSGPQAEALRNYISRKYRVAYDATGVLVNTTYRVAREKDLDPLLLLAVIAIESRYNPFAESSVGAQGLMQVMTRVHQDKFDKLGEGANALDPISNIRVGSTILKDCITRRGSVEGGLACYVGATGPSDGGYGAKVQAERRRLALAAGIALARD
ncbi:transglycosylase SLT domain-containing protein [Bordetella muralis]|jgi:soluble lytic murein transglycosylase-like protein|uniref:lytic transglycosylase domain-containing protein n=1 Tax=Bordetella muralis TaxID=1649130 RepID=UPI0039EDF5F5